MCVGPSQMGLYHPTRWVVLDSITKHTKQAISSTPLWLLCQFPLPGSCIAWVPALTSLIDSNLRIKSWNKQLLFYYNNRNSKWYQNHSMNHCYDTPDHWLLGRSVVTFELWAGKLLSAQSTEFCGSLESKYAESNADEGGLTYWVCLIFWIKNL